MKTIKDKIKTDLSTEKKDLKEIFYRIKKRDFLGNTGLAIKNSAYQTLTNIFAKIGSFVFTIIVARLLLPELFGLYNLALSTILLFSAFSDLGVNSGLITFISKELGKNRKKTAKAYTYYFGKISLFLISISILALLVLSKFISENYYQKPLFLALLVGIIYLLFFELSNLLTAILQASNYFKGLYHKEIVFHVSRIILVPSAILLSLKYSLGNEMLLFYIILALAASYTITFLFLFYTTSKKADFLKEKPSILSKFQKKGANRFLLASAALILSGVFFSYIDRIMLGKFVASEFIGYYSAAFGLVGALTSLVGFGGALLPVFSRIKNKESLGKGLRKAVAIVFAIGLILFFFTLIMAPFVISLAYGSTYNLSINVLRVLSLLVIILPLIGIYSSYFLSMKRPQAIIRWLVISTILNIVLNYVLITSLLRYGELSAVFGACIATIISQGFYLFGLVFSKK